MNCTHRRNTSESTANQVTRRNWRNTAAFAWFAPIGTNTWTLIRGEETVQVSFSERIAVNKIALVRGFAALGLGIAPLDALLAREDVAAGRLRRVLPDWHFHPVPVFALTPTKLLPVKTRAFIEFLVDRMRRIDPGNPNSTIGIKPLSSTRNATLPEVFERAISRGPSSGSRALQGEDR